MNNSIPHTEAEKEREAFERWYAKAIDGEHFGVYEDPDQPGSWIYLERDVSSAWYVWQARAALLEPVGEGWVSVEERLPEMAQSVALINVDRWENTGGDLEMNVRACGYLADAGPFKYWSIRGERATSLDAYTHWLALPAFPKSNGGMGS